MHGTRGATDHGGEVVKRQAAPCGAHLVPRNAGTLLAKSVSAVSSPATSETPLWRLWFMMSQVSQSSCVASSMLFRSARCTRHVFFTCFATGMIANLHVRRHFVGADWSTVEAGMSNCSAHPSCSFLAPCHVSRSRFIPEHCPMGGGGADRARERCHHHAGGCLGESP